MSLGLEGRVIVVTGGASGIGRATAELCAQRAAHVVVADVAVDHGTELAADLSSRGHSAMFVECDVSNESDVHELMDRTTRAFGRLDVLIACAGILEGAAIGVEDLDVETFDRVLDINARGSFLCAKHAIRAMGPSGDGVVLLLASGAGVTAGSSSYAYGASKGAVHGLGLVLQNRLQGRSIRVNTVAPGSIATPLKHKNVEDVGRSVGTDEATIRRRQAELFDPSGVARVLSFLASPEADYVRGTVFTC